MFQLFELPAKNMCIFSLLYWYQSIYKYRFTYASYRHDLVVPTQNIAKPTNNVIKVTYQEPKPWSYQLLTDEKTYIDKNCQSFGFCKLFFC